MLRFDAVLLTILLASFGCHRPTPRIQAGGATFINPIMQHWAADRYRAEGIEIDYIKKGSGYGIQQTIRRTLDFGCTDTPLTRAELAEANRTGGEVLLVPLAIGAVVVIHHLPGVEGPLTLSGPVIANIYRRKITRWNDPQIATLNPGMKLPDQLIVPVHRAESSGTTYTFTEYLGKVSPEFAEEVGVSKKPRWPGEGIGQEGSDGVTGHVLKNPYSLGYVEAIYARRNRVAFAKIRNRCGFDLLPEPENVTAAAAAGVREPRMGEPYSLHESGYSLTDTPGEKSYPIVGMSYAVLYREQPREKGRIIRDFLNWAVTEGQFAAGELGYAPLPESLRIQSAELLNRVKLP